MLLLPPRSEAAESGGLVATVLFPCRVSIKILSLSQSQAGRQSPSLCISVGTGE